MSIRILLADDHRMFREALCSQLAAEKDIRIVGETGSAAGTLAALAGARPDVVVLDIALPDGNGIDVARAIVAGHPEIRIVALSGYVEPMYVEEAMKAGAHAYVVKSAGIEELLRAIRAVLAGHRFLSPEVTCGMVPQATLESPPTSLLTAREKEVLRLIASGRRSAEIAASLGISAATVEVHRRNIRKKLRLNSVADLTRYAIRQGIESAY
jgi:two-component system NarL family response regulator